MSKNELSNNVRRLRFDNGEMTQQDLADVEQAQPLSQADHIPCSMARSVGGIDFTT